MGESEGGGISRCVTGEIDRLPCGGGGGDDPLFIMSDCSGGGDRWAAGGGGGGRSNVGDFCRVSHNRSRRCLFLTCRNMTSFLGKLSLQNGQSTDFNVGIVGCDDDAEDWFKRRWYLSYGIKTDLEAMVNVPVLHTTHI